MSDFLCFLLKFQVIYNCKLLYERTTFFTMNALKKRKQNLHALHGDHSLWPKGHGRYFKIDCARATVKPVKRCALFQEVRL